MTVEVATKRPEEHAGHTNEIQLTDDIKLIMKYPTLKDIAVAMNDSETEALFEMISNGWNGFNGVNIGTFYIFPNIFFLRS